MILSPAQYLLRIDDLCPTVSAERWQKFQSLIEEFRLRPILAVVPDNRDPELQVSPPDPAFWDCMRALEAAGAAIGLVSAIMECKPTRVAAGFVAGLLGGALGGWLGYQMYASLMDIAKPEWGLKRMIEGSTGAILGAVLWAILVILGVGAALRFARTSWGWTLAVLLGVLASPRLLIYMLSSLLASLRTPSSRAPKA